MRHKAQNLRSGTGLSGWFIGVLLLIGLTGSFSISAPATQAQPADDAPVYAGEVSASGATYRIIDPVTGLMSLPRPVPAARQDSRSGEIIVFDTVIGAQTLTAGDAVPRTQFGVPLTLGVSGAVEIEALDLFFYSAVNANVKNLRVQFAFYNNFEAAVSPVFNDLAGAGIYVVDYGPHALAANSYQSMSIQLEQPISLTDGWQNGFVVNFQADFGQGITESDDLTPLLRADAPYLIGSVPLPNNSGFYRDTAGDDTFNFNSDELELLPGMIYNTVALRIYGRTLTGEETSVPTLTPTTPATEVPTDSPTDVPTSTPTATPTDPAGSTQLLANTGFEAVNDSGKPDPGAWDVKKQSRDRIKCNKPGKNPVARTGNCAFRFKGGPDENSRLQQVPDISTLPLTVGDTLRFSAFVDAGSSAQGKIRVVVTYTDLTASKLNLNLLPTGAIYAEVTGILALNSAAVSQVKVQFRHNSPSGKVYVDDVSLLHLPAGSVAAEHGVIPLP